MRKYGTLAYHVSLLFSFLGVLFIPFSFRYFSIQSSVTTFLFENLSVYIASCFECIRIGNPEITSDSTTLYVLFFVLFFSALVLVVLFSFFDFWKNKLTLIVQIIQLVLTFYLSIVMLKYGFDKIVKAQFYLPEPNTLYTPLGLLDKDLLYWSTMGTSHTYNIFMGLAEVVPALLLLFSRTRILGLLVLFGVLMNVVFVNLGFDISVKLYSLFLLFVCGLLLVPSVNSFFKFFFLNKSVTLTPVSFKTIIPSRVKRISLKAILILLFFVESLFPYILSGHYNDDTVPRNYLHGAYQIIRDEDGNACENSTNQRIKRIFIHRHNYFIFQYEDDSMEDFHLEIKPDQNEFILTNDDEDVITVKYTYSETTKILVLKFVDLNRTIYSKSLPWQDLPLLQPLFHWTVDGVN